MMQPNPVTWVEQVESVGATADLHYGYTLLRAVQQGSVALVPGPLVRVYRPEPTVSFGQQDVRLSGYEEARRRCIAHGFTPVVRRSGGRAAAYHRGSLVIDHIQPEDHAMFGFRERFEHFGELLTQMLRSQGVEAGVGEIPGEYCAGEYSVHAKVPHRDNGEHPVHRIKLAGTAQRVVKGAWIFSASLILEDGAAIREVLIDVYDALGLEFDPATAGAAEDAVARLTVESTTAALLAEYHDSAAPGADVAQLTWRDLLDRVPLSDP